MKLNLFYRASKLAILLVFVISVLLVSAQTNETTDSFAVTGRILYLGGVNTSTDYIITFFDASASNEIYSFPLAASGGEFRVEGISEGKYMVQLWNDDVTLILPDPINIEISQKTAPNNVFELTPFEVKPAKDKIQGRVFNIRNNNGVSDVIIYAQSESGRSAYFDTKTDENGNYELTVFPGQWIVWPDFGERKDIVQAGDAVYITVESDVTSIVDFPVISADATLNGIVTLDGVMPIAGLSAYVEFRPINSDLPVLGANVEDGKFSLQLPSATYGVWLYLPSGSDYGLTTIQPLQQVTLEEDQTGTIIITVKERDAVIEGAVKDPKGNIIKDVPVKVYAETAGIVEEADVDTATGRYQLRVYSGVYRTWTISYYLGDTDRHFFADNTANYALPVSSNAHVTQDIILYEADSVIKGEVFDASGKPLSDVTVVYSNTDYEGNLFDFGSALFSGSVTTGSDGIYEILVPSGTYRLYVSLDGFMSPPDQIVNISPNNPGKADFRFLPSDATIFGQVRLDRSGVLAFVSAWSEGGASVNSYTDAEGNFVLRVSNDVWHLGSTATIDNKYYVSDEIVVDMTNESSKQIVIDLRLEQEFEFILPPPITRTFDANRLTIINLDDGTKITIPAGSIQKSGELTIIASPTVFLPAEENARPIGLGYDLQARDANGKNIVKFPSDVFIAIPYTSEQLQLFGLTEDDLVPSYWDEKAGTWIPVKNVFVDRESGFIVVATNHFTKFAIVTQKPITAVLGISSIAVKQVPKEQLEMAVKKVRSRAIQPIMKKERSKPQPIQKSRIPINLILIGSLLSVIILLAYKMSTNKNFLLLSLDDTKIKKVSNAVSNDSSRKILGYLSNKEATESELADKLQIPISTVHYNIQQLMEAGLVNAKEFHYSKKGKEVIHYKLTNKYIIIAHKKTNTSMLNKVDK